MMKNANTMMTLFGEMEKKGSSKLNERFLIPPFSIFDTKQGYWQSRKREWLALGIKSEVGRGDALTFRGMPCFDYDDTKKVNAMGFNNKEKHEQCLAEIDEDIKIQATSIFDPVLCEIVYRWFAIDGDKVLDPFSGGSVRGVVASFLDRNYTGIDLSPEQIKANNANMNEILENNDINYKPKWICGDSINIKQLTNEEKYDLVFSCPPYYNLEVYSDADGDISNCETYEDFLIPYEQIIKNACDLLKNDRFACFVVGSVRDKKLGYYHDFIGDTIRAFKKAGLYFYNEGVLVNVTGTLPVRISRQFNSGRKFGKQHQNVLVFYKGDIKNIKERYGDVILE